ncbi:MAG: exo-alpha-sialidase [Ruminococcaceae bacterium]|nr:exo-alpha-sialidase [Oscillospiraceae bacterium]
MKKIVVKSRTVIAESDQESLLWGGFQIPLIRYANGALIVKFMGRKDAVETYGKEDLDHIYISRDYGKNWEKGCLDAWRKAATLLPNGDRIDFVQRKNIVGSFDLPPAKKMAFGSKDVFVYPIDELKGIVSGLEKSFTVTRLRRGEEEPQEEICTVNWKDMPVNFYPREDGSFFTQISSCANDVKIDKNGVLWFPVYAEAPLSKHESATSRYYSVHLLRSDDLGHSWDYVSSVYYDPACNVPDAYSVEGFNEATLEILENGDFLMIMRSGSLHPLRQDGRPIPKMFSVRSSDEGKTWSKPQVFFDYGIHPHSLKTEDGTILLISGRPGVYLMTCDDPEGKTWSPITELVSVPESDVMTKYFEYTCSNADLCICDNGRIFATYSAFDPTKQPPVKSIVVSEIGIEDAE